MMRTYATRIGELASNGSWNPFDRLELLKSGVVLAGKSVCSQTGFGYSINARKQVVVTRPNDASAQRLAQYELRGESHRHDRLQGCRIVLEPPGKYFSVTVLAMPEAL